MRSFPNVFWIIGRSKGILVTGKQALSLVGVILYFSLVNYFLLLLTLSFLDVISIKAWWIRRRLGPKNLGQSAFPEAVKFRYPRTLKFRRTSIFSSFFPFPFIFPLNSFVSSKKSRKNAINPFVRVCLDILETVHYKVNRFGFDDQGST